jgi:uncharacterized protein (DUF433 family)
MRRVKAVATDIYQGRDPRSLPIYSVGDVARHLRLPRSTVHAWVRSRAGSPLHRRVIVPDDQAGKQLSFRNLVEVHVLSSLRGYSVPMPQVREAIAFLRKDFDTEHPLAEIDLSTDHRDIFIDYFGTLMAISRGRQAALEPVVKQYLERVQRNEKGLLQRLYPFVNERDSRRIVAIDPQRKFGRPFLVAAGVKTSVIASRHRAGESVRDLAADFDTTKDLIEGAIRFESARQKAA